jgi:hypothetical protein
LKGTGTRRDATLDTSRPTGRGTFLRRTVTGDLREQAGLWSNLGEASYIARKG